MEWQTMTNVEIGDRSVVEGRWCITEEEAETRLYIRSNDLACICTVNSAIHPDGYPVLAKLAIQGLNSIEPRK